MTMRFFFLAVLVITLPWTAFSQMKPIAMLLPVYFVEYEVESGRKSIENHLVAELSRYFELKSEEEVAEALALVSEEIDSENCSEEACIKKMGEVLDVDFTLIFEIIVSESEWSIMGKRLDLEGVPSVINEVCAQCNLVKSRQLLSEMVISLRPGDKMLQMGKASMIIETDPSADLFVNGNPYGRTPLEITVNAGENIDYIIIAEGYREYSEVVVLKPGQKLKINKKLARKRGNIRILSDPTGSTVFLDGKLQRSSDGSEDKTPIDLRPTYGSHQLLLKNDKYKDFETTLQISKRDHGKKTFDLEPEPGRLLVRVPAENKNAQIFTNDEYLGNMGGRIAETFEVPANVSLEVYAKEGQAISLTKTVNIEPGGSDKVDFQELEAPTGFQAKFGAALALDYLTFQTDTANKPIKSSYNLFGFEIHSLLLPSRYRIAISSFSGDGEFTDQTTPFYIVVNSELFPIEKTSASLLRILVTPGWQPGWIYSIGYEQSTFLYSGGSGTLSSKRNSLSVEGGYESSEFFDFMIDKDLFQETKLRYSTATGFGLSFNLGGIFF